MTREQAREAMGGEGTAAGTTTDGPTAHRGGMSGDVAEVAGLLQAQRALRDELLGELHRSRGNAFVQQVLAASSHTGAAEDQVANNEPGLLWDRKPGLGGGQSETKKSADTSTKDRRPEPERRAEQSDNATYHAMNSKLKLLALELHAAGKKLTFDVAIANAAKNQDKAEIEETDARLSGTIHRLDDMARETAKQLNVLNTEKGEPRLAEGAQNLRAALDELAPVMADVDGWMTAHKLETPSWEVVGRSNGILKLVFPDIAPVARPLTSLEKSSGFTKNASIDAHLDAAIAAAESVKTGTRYHSDRVILHAKEIAELLKNHPRIPGGLEPRIKKLLSLVDQILVDNPYLKDSFDEALGPIRNVK